MKKDIAEFISKCLVCQYIKAEHQVPVGLLQPLSMPEWKCGRITMNFVYGLPRTQRSHDVIRVMVDKVTKIDHFLEIRVDYSRERLAKLYINEIETIHDIHVSIVFNIYPRFTSKFCANLHEALGTRLNFCTSFHPQTDNLSKRIIQFLEDMLQAFVLEFEGYWVS